MNDWERDLEASKARNIRNIKTLNSIINVLNEENEKLRLDLCHRDNELRQKVDYIHELLEINETYKDLLKECLAHLSLGEIGTSVTPINILIDRINTAIGDNEIQANPVADIKIQESEA